MAPQSGVLHDVLCLFMYMALEMREVFPVQHKSRQLLTWSGVGGSSAYWPRGVSGLDCTWEENGRNSPLPVSIL